jgi:hypothetical protein
MAQKFVNYHDDEKDTEKDTEKDEKKDAEKDVKKGISIIQQQANMDAENAAAAQRDADNALARANTTNLPSDQMTAQILQTLADEKKKIADKSGAEAAAAAAIPSTRRPSRNHP